MNPSVTTILPTSRSVNASNRYPWLAAVLSVVAALAVYAVTLHGTYVYDDVILHEDARFTHPAQWSKFWTQDYMPGAVDRLYRPLTCMTFAVEYWLHGDRPWIYHLVNWLLHAGAAAAVAELARRLFGFRTAIAAGILFAVHPVHVEAVAGLVGRAELLCTLATVLGLILFLKPMNVLRAMAILLCLAIAILSKEQGILLPLFLLAVVPFRRASTKVGLEMPERAKPRSREVPREVSLPIPARPADREFDSSPIKTSRLSSRLRVFARSGPFMHSTSDKIGSERGVMLALFSSICFVCAAYIVFREQLLGFTWDRQQLEWTANPLIRSTGIDRFLMPVVLLGRYALLLVAPLKLSLDYGTHVVGWTVDWRQPFFYLGTITLLLWFAAAGWALRRRNWAALFCLVALAISYGMVSNSIILIGTIMGERLMYLPSAFFLILVAALLARWLGSIGFMSVILILATLGSIRAYTYARLWNDPLKLILADLADHPQSMHLHSLAVDQYLARGDFLAAREIGRDSVRVLPDCWESYRMVAAADVKLHDWADAEQVLTHADRRCPGLRISHLIGNVEKARAEWNGSSAPLSPAKPERGEADRPAP